MILGFRNGINSKGMLGVPKGIRLIFFWLNETLFLLSGKKIIGCSLYENPEGQVRKEGIRAIVNTLQVMYNLYTSPKINNHMINKNIFFKNTQKGIRKKTHFVVGLTWMHAHHEIFIRRVMENIDDHQIIQTLSIKIVHKKSSCVYHFDQGVKGERYEPKQNIPF